MWRLLSRMILRQMWRSKVLTLINILSIAVGVAVFLSVRVINHSAKSGFSATLDAVAGKANLQAVGNGAPFPEELFFDLQFAPGVLAATPAIERITPLADGSGEYFRLLGVDPFSSGPFQTFEVKGPTSGAGSDTEADRGPADAFFYEPNTIAILKEWGDENGWDVGDEVAVELEGRIEKLRIVSYLEFEEPVPGMDQRLAVMDIANAQELFGVVGQLDRIDFIVSETFEVPEDVEIPTQAMLTDSQRRGKKVDRMLEAFDLNLSAMSLIALFVGLFLIYNTMVTEGVRRRKEIGILKSLGMKKQAVVGLFMAQATVIGAVGVGLGVFLGLMMSQAGLGSVTQVISSMYILTSVKEILVEPWFFGMAAALGLIATWIGAWGPSKEAASIEPTRALQMGAFFEDPQPRAWRGAVWGLMTLALSGALAVWVWNGGYKWLGFVSAFLLMLGISFLAPATTLLMTWILQRLVARSSNIAHLALHQVSHALNRIGITIAALACALAMMLGVSSMIHSFRVTVGQWVEQVIRADIYISMESQMKLGAKSFLNPELMETIRSQPGVTGWDTFREIPLDLDGYPIKMGFSRLEANWDPDRIVLLAGDHSSALEAVQEDEVPAILISETFASKLGYQLGDDLKIPTPKGSTTFNIVGVFRDYTSDGGVALTDRKWLERLWDETGMNGLALYLDPETEIEPMIESIESMSSRAGEYVVYSNRDLRKQIFDIFDQTFAVTYLLRVVAVGVAVIGVFLTLTALVTERTREIGILRSNGALPGQIQQMIWWESGVIGLTGYCLGAVGGIGLAGLLVHIINKAFFGWTIEWSWPSFLFLEAPLLAIGAALIAGAIPAWRAGKIPIAAAVREE